MPLVTLKEKVLQFFEGQPPIVKRLAAQRADRAAAKEKELKKLNADYHAIGRHMANLQLPSKRAGIVDWLIGEPLASYEGPDLLQYEGCAISHDVEGIAWVGRALRERQDAIVRQAVQIFESLYRAHASDLAAELEEARAKFGELFAFYGCAGSENHVLPVQTLQDELDRARDNGRLDWRGRGPEDEMRHWGVV